MQKLSILTALILPLAAQGPINDHFKDATILPAKKFPLIQKGSMIGPSRVSPATREPGEINHAGKKTGGSVWYSFTPKTTRRIQVEVRSAKFAPILAAYTGNTATDLRLIHRYANFAFPAYSRSSTEPFTAGARIEFEATANQTYSLAVDTENDAFGPFTLVIKPRNNPFKPELEILKAGAIWGYLLVTDENDRPVDPKSLDPDFYKTWTSPDKYDGPRFGKGRAPLGYGPLASFKKVKTNINGRLNPPPPKGQRHSAYFRTIFTPELDVTAIGIEGIFDDGAIIYINGNEVSRLNVGHNQNANDWRLLATSSKAHNISSESYIHQVIVRNLNLPAGVPVNIAISLHNGEDTSSDLGMDLRLYSVE